MPEVREMPAALRPREKLANRGVMSLSDRELLMILLGSGTRNKGVSTLAEEVLTLLEKTSYRTGIDDLLSIRGLGKAKAGILLASLEFARRTRWPERRRIRTPGDIYPLVAHYADRKQEYFLCISLNGAHEVMAIRVVSIGLVNRTMVHPREVFAKPIAERATAIICCHNHPSGNLEPSGDDHEVTRRLKQSGELLGIPLLDHLIIGKEGYFSFTQRDEVNFHRPP
ncbi:MAG: DNA repair protein RadC [Spirochaetales bacterium]|jgi:DNA repair protein RadC|nr:DNA repair protein RadC [Spirochaetales bacterium]